MTFRHGVYTSEVETSLQTAPAVDSALPFVVGASPNTFGPVVVSSWRQFVELSGISEGTDDIAGDDGWHKHSLTSFAYLWFRLCGRSDCILRGIASADGSLSQDAAIAALNDIDTVYERTRRLPSLILVPYFGTTEAIWAEAKAKAALYGGRFKAVAIGDIQSSEHAFSGATPNIISAPSDAVTAKTVSSESLALLWPYIGIGNLRFDLSSVAVAVMNRVDAQNGDLPFVSPSNKNCYATGVYVLKGDGGEAVKARGQFPVLSVEAASVGVDGNALKVTMWANYEDAIVHVRVDTSTGYREGEVDIATDYISAELLNSITFSGQNITDYVIFGGCIYITSIPDVDTDPITIQLSGGSASEKATGEFGEPTLTLEAANSGEAGNNLRLEIYQSSNGVVVDIYDSESDDPATPVFTSYNEIISSESGVYISAITFNAFVDDNDSSVVIAQYVVATGEITVPSYNDAENPIIIQLSGGSNGGEGYEEAPLFQSRDEINATLGANGLIGALNTADGWVLWGNSTTAFPGSTDVKDYLLASRRMFNYVQNTFQLFAQPRIDNPLNRRQLEGVVNSFNQILASLQGFGALNAASVSIDDERNTTEQLIRGVVYFRIRIAPPPPMQEINGVFEFDVQGFEASLA